MKSVADVQTRLQVEAVQLVLPEAALLAGACLLFILAFVAPRRSVAVGLGMAAVIAAVAVAWTVRGQEAAAFAAAAAGTAFDPTTLAPIDPTGPAAFVRWLALGAAALFLLLAWAELSDDTASEYVACLLVAAAGTSLVGRANDLVSLYLALEMVSIPTYVLLYLPVRTRATHEATVKYFLLSVLSSGVLLFGFSYLYGLAGSTNLGAVVATLTAAHAGGAGPLAAVAGVMVVAGLAFRIAAVPFHFYAPDVYQGGPTGVVAQLAFLPKIVGFVALARLFGLAAGRDAIPFDPASTLLPLTLWVLAAVTMTVGNVLALLQDNLKRLFAYSGIAHTGYMLIGLVVASAVPTATDPDVSGTDTMLFYLVAYGLMTVGAFAVLLYLASGDGRPVETTDDLNGLGKSSPAAAALLAVFLFSLIGLPLTAGFAGKFLLFVGAFSAPTDPPMGNLYRILAAVAAVNAAVGAVYYLRLVGKMFLQDPLHSDAGVSRGLLPLTAAVVCAFGTLLFGVYPQPLAEAARRAAPLPPAAKPAVVADAGR